MQLSVKCNQIGVEYLIPLPRTLLTNLDVGSTLSLEYTCQQYRPSQCTLLINLDIEYAPLLRFAYQYYTGSIIRQGCRPSRRDSTRSSPLPLGPLLVGLKPDTLIRKGLHTSSKTLPFVVVSKAKS